MKKVGSEEPVHFLFVNQKRVGASPVRHPVAESVLDSWRKAFIELAVYTSNRDSRHILLQKTHIFLGMTHAIIEAIATHSIPIVFHELRLASVVRYSNFLLISAT